MTDDQAAGRVRPQPDRTASQSERRRSRSRTRGEATTRYLRRSPGAAARRSRFGLSPTVSSFRAKPNPQNGAGKSTLVKIACGLVRASAGEVQVCGALAGSQAARASLGYLAELFRFPGWATADEVLELHQRLADSDGGVAERTRLLDLVALADARKRRVEEMSKGMQQRLGIAQALVGRPRILLLDEPTSALDPVGRRTVRELLEEIRGRGVSVLLNSHLLSEVELVCDRVAILLGGRIVAAGTPAQLAEARGVEIETDEGVRVFDVARREDVPGLVAELVAAGRSVYGVRVLRSTLEEVYLEAVGGTTS